MFKAKIYSSKWISQRISGGVSGVGCKSVELEVKGEILKLPYLGRRPDIDPCSYGEFFRQGFSDNWTGATTAFFCQEVEFSKREVLEIIACQFKMFNGREWLYPINPYWYRPEMRKFILLYAELDECEVSDLVGVLFKGEKFQFNPEKMGDAEYMSIARERYAERNQVRLSAARHVLFGDEYDFQSPY